jgi:hypothetical protein
MTKYLLALVLLAGCAPADNATTNKIQEQLDALPMSEAIADFGGHYYLERYYDSRFGVVCYQLSGSSLSCVKTDSIK